MCLLGSRIYEQKMAGFFTDWRFRFALLILKFEIWKLVSDLNHGGPPRFPQGCAWIGDQARGACKRHILRIRSPKLPLESSDIWQTYQ